MKRSFRISKEEIARALENGQTKVAHTLNLEPTWNARNSRRLAAQRKQMLRADLPRLVKANLSTALIATLYDISQRTSTRWIKSLGLTGERPRGRKPRPKKRLHVEG
jgi:Fic family protein